MIKIKKLKKENKEQPYSGLKKEIKQSKLIFLYNLGSVFCLGLIFIFVVFTSLFSQKADAANRDRYILTECATHFMNATSYLTGQIRAYAYTGDKTYYQNYMTELEQTKTRELSIGKMKEIGVSQEEGAMLDQMMGLSDSLVPLEIKVFEYVAIGDTKSAIDSILGVEYNKALLRMQEEKLEFLNSLSIRTTARVKKWIALKRGMETFTAILTILIVVFQFRVYFKIRKKVIIPIIEVEKEMRNLAMGKLSEPFSCQPNTSEIGIMVDSVITMKRELKKYIEDISEKLTRMAEKDMTVRVDIDYIGDFSPIKTSMNTIIYSMNVILTRMAKTANQIEYSAKRVSNDSQEISAGAIQQTGSITEISETMMSISNLAEKSVSQAEAANKLATMAGEQLGKSNEHLQEMLNAMKEINDASDEIGKIVKTIEDIAAQTNMIALNASVEAARAGDAGKGFAIVAEEVRDLASKSAAASKNTSYMIQNSLVTIKNGVDIAQSASDTFVEVTVNAGKAAEAMSEISKACSSQFNSIANLTQNIEEIANVSQNYMTVSEKSAEFSSDLFSKSESLHDIVSEFHLKKRKKKRRLQVN